jgi:hypothetical protein
MRSWLGLLIVVFVACVRTSPQPAPPPQPPAPLVKVPEGCLSSLEGTWVHASDPSYEYLADDDGGTLSMVVKRRFVADAGFSPRRFRRPDAGSMDADADGGLDAGALDAGAEPEPGSSIRVELQRTAAGFVGLTLSPLTHPSGRTCEARFPTQVISCGDAGLLLETASATALGDECQPPSRPQEVPHVQHLLIRQGP